MRKQPAVSFSVGYAGRDLDGFVRTLQEAGVDRVVDVRALPLSRRRGFSKTALRTALEAAGIEYVHLRSAGNPYRDQKGDIERCLAMYREHLDASPGVLAEVQAALSGHHAALLCVEANHQQCHRSVIADRLQARSPGLRFRHL